MKALTSMKSVMALVMGMALFAGCDQSKEELDKTKVELAKATAERDLMKGRSTRPPRTPRMPRPS